MNSGWKLVPVEPTRQMAKAGEVEMMTRHTNLDCFNDPYVHSTYEAMLAAAPVPPAQADMAAALESIARPFPAGCNWEDQARACQVVAQQALAAPPPTAPPAGELAQLCQRLSTLLAQASPQPWVYRPDKFDDWGYIRGPVRDDRGIGPFRPVVAIGKDSLATEEQINQHRREHTDPYGPNAQLITEAVNALPVLLAAVLNQLEQTNGAG